MSAWDMRQQNDQTGGASRKTFAPFHRRTLHHGVLLEITISEDGGLEVSWDAGLIYTPAHDIRTTLAGSATCTDDRVNHLVWVSGTSLTLRITPPDHDAEVAVAHFNAGDGAIFDSHQEPLLAHRVPEIIDGLANIFPIVVTSGCRVTEDLDGTNPLDVTVSTGVFYHEAHDKHSVTGFDSRTASTLVRCNIDDAGPLWNFVPDQDEADFTQWNSGTSLIATSAGKWYRGLFVVSEDNVFWIYAQEQHNNLSAALNGSDPSVPAGLDNFPKSAAYVYKSGHTTFAEFSPEQWIDVRPVLNVTAAVTAGGLDNVVEDNSPQLGGDLDPNGNDINGTTTPGSRIRNMGVAEVQTSAPADPAEGTLWLDTDAVGGAVPGIENITTVSSAVTLDSSHANVACDASGGAFTVTLPAIADNIGRRYRIKKIDASANAVTVDANGSETVETALTAVLASEGDSITIIPTSAGWWIW